MAMSELFRYLKKMAVRNMLRPFRLFGIKQNRVFLHNDLSYKYCCNPRYICEYLLKKYEKELEIIFSVKNPNAYKGYDARIKFVRFNSLKYFYYAITSKVYVTNSGGYSYLPISKKQIVINTGHGGGAYKKMGRHMFEDTPLFRKDLLLSSGYTTMGLSTCHRFTEVSADSNLAPIENFWEIGMPRNDMLIHPDMEFRRRIRENLGLKEAQSLVLYAPTYRKPKDNYFLDSIAIDYDINVSKVIMALEKRFGGEWIFGFRLHPCVVNRECAKKQNVLDLSDYEEMQELLLAADVMINDFSSSMWDFMLTGKPGFMYAKDMEHYIKTTKVYTPVSDWPFSKAVTNEELINNILSFDETIYKQNCKKHYELLGGCETGKATELVGDYIHKATKEKGILSFKG